MLALPGYKGVLAYTLAQALWLARTVLDVLVGYPSADRAAIRALALDETLAPRVTLTVDSAEHLDFIDAVLRSRGLATSRAGTGLGEGPCVACSVPRNAS